LIEYHHEQEQEKRHIDYLKAAEQELSKRNLTLHDAINNVDENAKLLTYLREKGMMDEKGQMKI